MSGARSRPQATTVLLVGAGRQQFPAIRRARELALRVVAVDGDPGAPGLAEADVGEAVDFKDVAAVTETARRHGAAGVLTVASDQAVPVVAAVAEALGLPGIGSETAHVMTNKVAMRRRLERGRVPQPHFRAARSREEAEAGLAALGFPAVVKPADASGQRGLFLLRSLGDLDGRLDAAFAESSAGEIIFERFHEGTEVNHLVVARGGRYEIVTQSDRLRPPGAGFGIAVTHVHPSTLPKDVLEEAGRVAVDAVRTLGLIDGIGYPQVLVGSDGDLRVMEVAARIPGGQMADVARYGVGVDLVEIALRQALGREIDDELVRARFRRPLAIRFLTAESGPLPVGTVRSVHGLERVRAAPGVLAADVFLAPGEVVRPARRDADRRGYVVATGATSDEALQRADAAAELLRVEVG